MFRPVVTRDATVHPAGTEVSTPPEYALSARNASITALRQLLVRREALYGGLGINTLFSSPALAVIFEALPTASPSSAGYTPSAHMALLTGMRLLLHLSRSVSAVYYGILGVQQAAARLALPMPIEAQEIFKIAVKAIAKNPRQENPKKHVESDWVVDLSRATTDDDSARLGSLIAQMDHLDIHHEQ